jgi:hypothetical protein
LVEQQHPPIALAREHVEVVGHLVEAVEQQAGDVADGRLSLELDPDLLAHGRVPAIRADHQGCAHVLGAPVDVIGDLGG